MQKQHQTITLSKKPVSGTPLSHQEQQKKEELSFHEVWLDKQDILQRLHISSGTLFAWRKKGLLPYSKIIGKIYYKESDLQKLLHTANISR